MNTIIQRIEIDAGHRLLEHEGKCRNVHGHRYVFEVVLQSRDLDQVGRVVDFGEVKRIIGGWLDANWDHGFIYQAGDPIGMAVEREGSKCYRVKFPPTAENLAAYFLGICTRGAVSIVLPPGVKVVGMKVWETPNCRAEVGQPWEVEIRGKA